MATDVLQPPPPMQRPRLNSNFSDNEFVEALKVANYADTVRQLDHFYGTGMLVN